MSTTGVDALGPETAPGVVYDRYLGQGTLAYQECDDCAKVIFYPRVLCPACGSDALTWRESAGLGTVYSATTVHPRDSDAYNVSLVDVDEGFRMMSNVVGVPPTEVGIGLRVRLSIPTDAPTPIPQFVKES